MSARDLQVGLAELRRRPGNRIEVRRQVLLDDARVSTAAVPVGAEGSVDLVLEALSDGVTVTGTVRFPWEGECRRCLGPTSGEVVADVLEVFKDRPLGEDTPAIDGDVVDLGPVVRDAVVLGLPLAPLCSDDCPGPVPGDYPVVVEGTAPPAPDPRWSALAELRFDPEDPDSVG